MKIFISYTQRDRYITDLLLSNIANEVNLFGKPFVDILHNNAEDKQAFVEHKLLEADILLLLNSESINKSKWAQWEIATAEEQNIPIIQYSIHNDSFSYHTFRSFLVRNFVGYRENSISNEVALTTAGW